MLLADKNDGDFDLKKEPFEWIFLEDLADQEAVRQMSFYYMPFEFCCALRAWLHEYMFHKNGSDRWIFLDADIMVFGSLKELWDQLGSGSILLSPHLTKPVRADQGEGERLILQTGLFNGGCLGLRNTDKALEFIRWFKDRLRYYCLNEPPQFFVDQYWLNFVPLYFKAVNFLESPAANVGHWNAFQCRMEKTAGGEVTVNGRPLMFMHFSGLEMPHPARFSRWTRIDEGANKALLLELAELYRQKLAENDYENTNRIPYAFNYYNNGQPISLAMRRLYREELMKGAQSEPPFFMEAAKALEIKPVPRGKFL
ncbi:MAG: hypothetical protein AUJ71_01175, partial [Candidatus Omnitrophica bacterium CG1_02_49_16]